MSLAARIDGYWFGPVPATRLAAVRILVGLFVTGYVAARAPHLLSYATFDPALFKPVGVVALLSEPLSPWTSRLITLATVLLAVPFLLGWRYRITGPVFALLLLWTLTYRNSWGMIFHTENMMVLEVLLLGFVPAADAWSLDARRRGSEVPASGRYRWPLKLMCWAVVITYIIAGVAKLRFGGMAWLDGDLIRNWVALDNLRKLLLGSIYSPLAGPLLGWKPLWDVLAVLTIALEVLAPIGLLGKKWTAGWVIAVLAFHWGVLALMMIAFPYQLTAIGYACFFPVDDWLVAVWRRFRRRQDSRERRE